MIRSAWNSQNRIYWAQKPPVPNFRPIGWPLHPKQTTSIFTITRTIAICRLSIFDEGVIRSVWNLVQGVFVSNKNDSVNFKPIGLLKKKFLKWWILRRPPWPPGGSNQKIKPNCKMSVLTPCQRYIPIIIKKLAGGSQKLAHRTIFPYNCVYRLKMSSKNYILMSKP